MFEKVPLLSASLATVCIESFLYGIFTILFIASLYLLIHHQRTRSIRGQSPLVIASVTVYISITAHWICTFLRLFQAFVTFNSGATPIKFYADLTQTSEVVKTGFLAVSLIVGDVVIIYRLWIVWGYNKLVVIFPICTLIGLTVCGIGITYQFSQYQPGEDVFLSVAGRWITSDCAFTLCTNIYCSVLIAYRIWKIDSASRKYGGQNLNSVLGIIIESAALYTVWTIFFFACYQGQSNLQFVAVDGWAAISGISFMSINVRVGMGWDQNSRKNSSGTLSGGAITSRLEVARGGNSTLDSFAMRPLAVNITTKVDNSRDFRDGESMSHFDDSFSKPA